MPFREYKPGKEADRTILIVVIALVFLAMAVFWIFNTYNDNQIDSKHPQEYHIPPPTN